MLNVKFFSVKNEKEDNAASNVSFWIGYFCKRFAMRVVKKTIQDALLA